MDRHETSPFALQVFYRTGAFHRPDEFASDELPPFLTLHTWPDCTLSELARLITIADDQLLPDPAIGTRLAFRLMFQDTRGPITTSAAGAAAAKYTTKELGSVVIGDGGPGLDPKDADATTQLADTDADKTLSDARFVVGDFISCAILPPLADGSVARASSARTGRGAGAGESRAAVGGIPPNPLKRRDGGAFITHNQGKSTGRARFESGGGGGGFGSGGARGGGGGRYSMPKGEWRRGEKLPDVDRSPPGRSRNRGGF